MLRLLTFAGLALALAAPAFARAGSPKVAIFYYPWYSTAAHDASNAHWNQNGRRPPADIASNFYPLRGAYSSGDPEVLRQQMADIAASGAGVVVSSWWGAGSPEDARLPAVIAAARLQRLRVAVQIEPYDGRSAASVAADIDRLRRLGIVDFYVYRPQDLASSDWAAALTPRSGVRVFAQSLLVGWAAAARFSGIYTYDVLLQDGGAFRRLCEQAHRVGLLCAPSVGPGFDARVATGEERTRPRNDGATYDAMWRAALAAQPDIVTVTSYNEWHEGTQIEPAQTLSGSRYSSYDGAWGLTGAQAPGAYLSRTALWATAFDPYAAVQAQAVVARILWTWPDPYTRVGARGSRTR